MFFFKDYIFDILNIRILIRECLGHDFWPWKGARAWLEKFGCASNPSLKAVIKVSGPIDHDFHFPALKINYLFPPIRTFTLTAFRLVWHSFSKSPFNESSKTKSLSTSADTPKWFSNILFSSGLVECEVEQLLTPTYRLLHCFCFHRQGPYWWQHHHEKHVCRCNPRASYQWNIQKVENMVVVHREIFLWCLYKCSFKCCLITRFWILLYQLYYQVHERNQTLRPANHEGAPLIACLCCNLFFLFLC